MISSARVQEGVQGLKPAWSRSVLEGREAVQGIICSSMNQSAGFLRSREETRAGAG